MLSDFTFDPHNPDAFVQTWMDEIGALHRGKAYNGWVFFDEDGHPLDMRVTDVDGKWLDMGFDIEADPRSGWGFLIQRAKELGSHDLVMVHAHNSHSNDEAQPGPCRDLTQMIASGCASLEPDDINIHACILLFNDELDGVVWVSRASDVQARPDAGTLINGPEGRGVLRNIKMMAERGDPIAQRLLPVMQRMIDDADRGINPSKEDLLEAINLTTEGIIAEAGGKQSSSLLDLPKFDPTRMNKGFMN